MSRRIAALIITTAIGGGLIGGAAPASAHDLTCSTSRFAHREDLKKYSQLKVDDRPGAICYQYKKNVIRFVAPLKKGSRFILHQQVIKTSESGVGPFYTAVSYRISGVWMTYFG